MAQLVKTNGECQILVYHPGIKRLHLVCVITPPPQLKSPLRYLTDV